jgi:hypothetical protein
LNTTLKKTTKNIKRAENALYRSGVDLQIRFVFEIVTEENVVLAEKAIY